jgi:hypothetical protein
MQPVAMVRVTPREGSPADGDAGEGVRAVDVDISLKGHSLI